MAVCCNHLRPSCSPPGLSSAKTVLKFTGCSTMQHLQSIGNECRSKNVSITGKATCYHNYHFERNTSGQFNRGIYKNSKCANIEVHQVEDSSFTINTKLISSLKLFYVFTRPYVCIGIIFIIVSSSLIAIESLSDISLPFLAGILKVVAAFSCLLVYVNGINQVFDIDIDKINKPYLPLASGEMTIETGVLITSFFALMAFAIGISIGSKTLLWGLLLYFFIFSAYSVKLPFLRWKNSAIAAAFSIFANSGIILPVSTYLHIQTDIFGRQANFPKALAFGTIVLSLFFVVVALFKDIPDIEGDKEFGVRSLATRLGQNKVFWICVGILEMVYSFAIFVGATSSCTWSKLITVLSHAALSLILWNQANSTDLKNHHSLSSFYQFIWKLIYAECLLIALVR